MDYHIPDDSVCRRSGNGNSKSEVDSSTTTSKKRKQSDLGKDDDFEVMSVSEISSGSHVKKSFAETIAKTLVTLTESVNELNQQMKTNKNHSYGKKKSKNIRLPVDQFEGSWKQRDSLRRKAKQKLRRQQKKEGTDD